MRQELTDQQLVERAQQGDKQAFNLLIRKYQYKVLSLIGRYVSNQGDVADVAQETFIKAYRSLDSFRGESSFYTWLYRIAVNTSKNYLTAQGRKPVLTEIEENGYDGSELLQENANPERLLLSNEIKHVVFATIESLPEELRMAITLRELEGMSYDEIAAVMESPVGTVRSRISRARDAIDKEIQPLLQR